MSEVKDFTVRMVIQPIIEQIENITKPLEESFERSSKKISGELQLTFDTLWKMIIEHIKKVQEEVTKRFEVTKRGLENITGSLKGGIEEVFKGIASGGKVGGIGGALEGGIATIVEMVGGIQPELVLLIGIMLAIFAVLEPVSQGIGMIVKIISMPFKVLGVMLLQKMGPFFDISIKLSTILLKLFEGIGSKFDELYNQFIKESPENPMAASFGAFIGTITEMFIEPLAHAFVGIIVFLGKMLSHIITTVMVGVINFTAAVIEGVTGIKIPTEDLTKSMVSQMTNLDSTFDTFGAQMNAQADGLSESLGGIAFQAALLVSNGFNDALIENVESTSTELDTFNKKLVEGALAADTFQKQMLSSSQNIKSEVANFTNVIQTSSGGVSVAKGKEETVSGYLGDVSPETALAMKELTDVMRGNSDATKSIVTLIDSHLSIGGYTGSLNISGARRT